MTLIELQARFSQVFDIGRVYGSVYAAQNPNTAPSRYDDDGKLIHSIYIPFRCGRVVDVKNWGGATGGGRAPH